jgi:hypothetical protein
MTTICDSLVDQITGDFTQACAELAKARHNQRVKDTPAHRAAVADCRAQVDAVLDLFLDTRFTVTV